MIFIILPPCNDCFISECCVQSVVELNFEEILENIRSTIVKAYGRESCIRESDVAFSCDSIK